ncbi:hypothetical protein RHMOL_Rhmol03G0021600 [Rhododendron molle]|uniref:Uncharacterized protein n=1 Tax=Rhododendron molle TaxID=49168 RepID=A0ACC0P9F8_RHOML|nr:hypothetical protein RHMOL_Rhmol03G0021600 [Rhododendron molle]
MASTSSEAPPSSPAETPTVNNSTKTKSNSSKRSFVANFKAKFCVSKPKPLKNNHHNADSSSTATTNKNDDLRGALSLSSKMIRNDLLAVDSAFAEAKKYMDHMNVKINQAHEKFEDLQTLGGSQRDFDELRKDVMKLKFQIPSHGKICSADSNPRRNRWPNINEAEDGMSHFFYKEPEDAHTGDFDGLLEAFHGLSQPWQRCLLCFFKFPPAAIIKRTTMIYLWIGLGLGYTWLSASNYVKMIFDKDDYGNTILNEFVEKGFIQPIYQNCSLAPDSCRMSISVRSALYEAAKATVINWESEIFANTENIRSLCLGRWQNSATHHIELADAKILHGLKDLKSLTFLSLRGISMITELPASILKLKNLAILDLQACHNLEVIPEDIGLLDNLTHLDMSECYFLEHMPESLAQLSNLEVLKGFLIGDFNNNKQSCTLHDLSRLWKLRKLNIYTKSRRSRHGTTQTGPQTLPPGLQKLDLQCFPTQCLTNWLCPYEIWGLKKLYISGGQLCDLGEILEDVEQQYKYNVEILRLKYLSKLKIDWSELRILFPKLIYLHQEECPKLTNFPCDERGVWMNMKAPRDERGFWMNMEAIDFDVLFPERLITSHVLANNDWIIADGNFLPDSTPNLHPEELSGIDFDELRKDITKLRSQISSRAKIRPADSNPHRKRWPNINEAEDRMSHFFYKEPEDTHTGDFDGLLEAFHDLCLRWRHCLLCFFKFPPEAIIKSASGCGKY